MNWIVCADYAQLELRIQALVASDDPLLEVFAEGGDPHKANAADIFGCKPENVMKGQRNMAKVAVYQMNYGGDPTALWKVLIVDFPDVTVRQVYRVHHMWFKKHWKIKAYHNEQLRLARQNGYIEAPLSGHRLQFYGKIDPTKVYNYPIQHTAADIINPTVELVDKALDWPVEGILAQVHDELVVDGPDPLRLARILKKCMTRTVTIAGRGMTFPVDIKIGPDWGNCIELDSSKPLASEVKRVVSHFKRRGYGKKGCSTRRAVSANRARKRAG